VKTEDYSRTRIPSCPVDRARRWQQRQDRLLIRSLPSRVRVVQTLITTYDDRFQPVAHTNRYRI